MRRVGEKYVQGCRYSRKQVSSPSLVSLADLLQPFPIPTQVWEELIRLHGFPNLIIYDSDLVFISHVWKEFLTLLGTRLKFRSVFHPQTNGETEVVNRIVKPYLRCFLNPKHWLKWLAQAEFWFNSSYYNSIQTIPLKTLYSREPPPIIKYQQNGTAVEYVYILLMLRDAVLED